MTGWIETESEFAYRVQQSMMTIAVYILLLKGWETVKADVGKHW